MAGERVAEHRGMSLTVNDLRAHVQSKIDDLPRLAKRFHLDEYTVGELWSHLQSEVDYYGTLPPEVTFSEIVENHFAQVSDFNQKLGVK